MDTNLWLKQPKVFTNISARYGRPQINILEQNKTKQNNSRLVCFLRHTWLWSGLIPGPKLQIVPAHAWVTIWGAGDQTKGGPCPVPGSRRASLKGCVMVFRSFCAIYLVMSFKNERDTMDGDALCQENRTSVQRTASAKLKLLVTTVSTF